MSLPKLILTPTSVEHYEKATLGQRYRDTRSGFEGIAIARTDYIHDSSIVLLDPYRLNPDASRAKPEWCAEFYLALIEHAASASAEESPPPTKLEDEDCPF